VRALRLTTPSAVIIAKQKSMPSSGPKKQSITIVADGPGKAPSSGGSGTGCC